jgi:hypothetical protein
MIALIGAFGRLTDGGMTVEGATNTVLRILCEANEAAPREPFA